MIGTKISWVAGANKVDYGSKGCDITLHSLPRTMLSRLDSCVP